MSEHETAPASANQCSAKAALLRNLLKREQHVALLLSEIRAEIDSLVFPAEERELGGEGGGA